MDTLILIAAVAALTGLAYYITVTRLSIAIKALAGDRSPSAHIYWVYTNRFLIWLTDRKFLVSALLLFNYNRMVSDLLQSLNPSLKGKRVVQISCAFGDLSRRIARRCAKEGAERVVVLDVVRNEVRHTKRKIERAGADSIYAYAVEDATNMAHPDGSFDYAILFFLFHELPAEDKARAMKEAARVLKPGGKIIFGEFHQPEPLLLKISGYVFFKVMEPYAHEMWSGFDAREVLDRETQSKWHFDKKTYFYGNYQVFTATKEG